MRFELRPGRVDAILLVSEVTRTLGATAKTAEARYEERTR